ncbi:MAG: hypothetical protein U0894_08755 [Pirellulales bacterium]
MDIVTANGIKLVLKHQFVTGRELPPRAYQAETDQRFIKPPHPSREYWRKDRTTAGAGEAASCTFIVVLPG